MSSDEVNDVDIHKLSDGIMNVNMEDSFDLAKDNMEDLEYDLKSYQHRGLVVVFNHENFDFDLTPRTGTEKDAVRLQAAFKARGFLVLTYNDKTHEDIKSVLGNVSKSKREAYGSVVIVALSHGLDGGQIAARDKFYSASDLREPFLDNPAFKDKPLIFIHQACRGKQKETFASRKSLSTFKNGDELYSGQNDILLAFGTLEGHESFRHKELGSFYIQKMCDILGKGDDIEILDLLTATNCVVIEDCAKNNERTEKYDKVQTATFKSTLLKRFVLSKCTTHEEELNSISDEIQTPEECYVSQPECEYRGLAIIFHDENHNTEANKFLDSMKELNFSCQTVDHEPTDRELTNLSANLHLEDCSCLFIGMFFAELRLNFLHSRLLEFLNNKICSYMNAKPKIFLLACKEGTTLKKDIKMDEVQSNRLATCYSDILAIYGYSSNFLNSFAANLRATTGSDVIASVRFAQRQTNQEKDRPCNVIMSSTLRFRVDWSKEMLVHNGNALKVSSLFSYHLRDPVANFEYREKELEVLRNVLQNDSTKSRRYSVNVWVTGFGGLGKSQTVMQYIMLARTQDIYQNFLWIDGSSPDSIKRDIQNIAESLDINLPIGGTLNDKLQRFYSKITDYGKTLLVVDNLENLKKDEIICVLPKEHKKELLRVVVTSVHNVDKFKLSAKVEKCISISPFTPEESNEFISKNLKTKESIPEVIIATLGEALSYFPLGLAIAVGLANEKMKSSTSPSDVIENIITNMQNLQRSGSQTRGYNKSLHYVVSCTLDHLEKNEEKLALQYLKMMSFCEPENIPHRILFQSSDTKPVKKLKSLQIINTNANLYSIHRIVQKIVCDSLSDSEEQKCILQFLMENVVQLQNESIEYSKTKPFLLHAAKVCSYIGSFPDLYTSSIDCIIAISSELQLVGWYEDAVKFNENHLKFSYQIFGDDSKQYSDLLIHKVQVLQQLKEYEEALSWITVLETLEPYTKPKPHTKKAHIYTGDQMIEIQYSGNLQNLCKFSGKIESFGDGFEKMVKILTDTETPLFVPRKYATQVYSEYKFVLLNYIQEANDTKIKVEIEKAKLLLSVGEINEALEVTKNLLQLDEICDLITTIDIINVRAELLECIEKFEEALELYDRALEIRRQTPKGNVHYDLTMEHNRASVLIKMKKYEEAKKILFLLKNEKDINLGESHPSTLRTRHTISTLLYKMGEREEALKYINCILRDIGDNNKYILIKLDVLENKSKILVGLKNVPQALEIMQDVYNQRVVRFGENDLKARNDMFTIARFYQKMQDFESAMNWLNNLLSKQKQRRTENPITILMTQIEMSKILVNTGKYDEASDLEKIIFEVQCQIYGERHYRIGKTMRRIAKLLYMKGKYVDALQKCDNAIEIVENENPERFSLDIIKMKHLKGVILIANQNFVEAFVTLQDVMQKIQTCQHIEPAFVCAVKLSLSHVLSKLGHCHEALAMGEEVFDQCKEILGLDHLDTIAAMNNKAYLLHCVGRNTQALSEIETVEKLREEIFGVTNPHTLHTKYFKGLILSDLAKHSDALRVFDFVLDHRKKVLDEDHPEVYHTIHHRAKVLLNMGRYDEALTAFNGLLESEKRKYGAESVQATCAMNSIATCYERMGQTFEAVEMYSAALQILEGLLGHSHPNVEIVRQNRDSAVQKFVANLQQ